MKFLTKISLALIILVTNYCDAQRFFRVKDVFINKKPTEFLLPPHSKLGCEGLFRNKKGIKYKDRFLYQRIIIKHLNSNYYESLDRIDNAKYEWDNKLISLQALQDNEDIPQSNIPINIFGGAVHLYHNKNYTNLVIEINYNFFLEQSDSVINRFNQLSFKLFQTLDSIEAQLLGKFNHWPPSISQSIVEKTFGVIPIPQEVSLARYCYIKNDNNTLVLLNPLFKLGIDSVDRVVTANGRLVDFNDVYKGLKPFEFARNQDGKIVQNKLGDFKTVNAVNRFKQNDIFLISSAADIQYSNKLKDIPYIFLYSVALKRNNSYNIDPGESKLHDDDPLYENSCFVHLNNSDVTQIDFSMLDITNKGIAKSVFGLRNSIFTFFEIYVNSDSDPDLKQITSTTRDISRLPKKYKFYRKYNGNYKRMKGNLEDLILLPNDKIKYKL